MLKRLKRLLRRLLPPPLYSCLRESMWHHTGNAKEAIASNINTREYWNQIWEKEGLDSRDEDQLHQAIISYVPEGVQVLDVGCGNGQLIRKLIRDKLCTCTGADISELVLELLKAELQIETLHTALPKLPVHNESFDVAICSECLEHLDHPAETVREMHRVVKDGGRLIITVPDGCIWKKGGEHVQEFTPTDCVGLLRALVREVHLQTLVDPNGWPYLLAWGVRCREPVRYADSLLS